jgi:hypothetical protein
MSIGAGIGTAEDFVTGRDALSGTLKKDPIGPVWITISFALAAMTTSTARFWGTYDWRMGNDN